MIFSSYYQKKILQIINQNISYLAMQMEESAELLHHFQRDINCLLEEVYSLQYILLKNILG